MKVYLHILDSPSLVERSNPSSKVASRLILTTPQWTARWVNTYSRFNHWIYRTFMTIERNAMSAQGIKLYFEGARILK